MRVTYIDNLSTGLDSLAQTEEDNEPGQRQGQRQVILEPVQVAEVGKSRPDIKDIFLPELLRAGLQSGAVLSYSGGTPGGGGGSMVQISQEEIFISWLAFVAENKYFDAYLEVHLIYTYTSYILHYYMAQQSLYLFN